MALGCERETEVLAAEGYREVRRTKPAVTLVAEVVHLPIDKS